MTKVAPLPWPYSHTSSLTFVAILIIVIVIGATSQVLLITRAPSTAPAVVALPRVTIKAILSPLIPTSTSGLLEASVRRQLACKRLQDFSTVLILGKPPAKTFTNSPVATSLHGMRSQMIVSNDQHYKKCRKGFLLISRVSRFHLLSYLSRSCACEKKNFPESQGNKVLITWREIRRERIRWPCVQFFSSLVDGHDDNDNHLQSSYICIKGNPLKKIQKKVWDTSKQCSEPCNKNLFKKWKWFFFLGETIYWCNLLWEDVSLPFLFFIVATVEKGHEKWKNWTRQNDLWFLCEVVRKVPFLFGGKM